jgi:hypothetical protein
MPVGNELRMGRIAIDKLIKADPVMITLSRPATNGVEDAEGGLQVGPPTPIAPQQFKKTMMKRRFFRRDRNDRRRADPHCSGDPHWTLQRRREAQRYVHLGSFPLPGSLGIG